jgi:hypothetical protein
MHYTPSGTATTDRPHLHVRGKACLYEVIRSDGGRSTLLDIPRYDFNWELLYRLHEPLARP